MLLEKIVHQLIKNGNTFGTLSVSYTSISYIYAS